MKKKVKTPRLTDKDRKYILKNDDTLIVEVMSHAAACRYGAHTSWCISVPSDPLEFRSHKRNCILIFIFLNRNTPDEYKICVRYRKSTKAFRDWFGPKQDNSWRGLSQSLFNEVVSEDLRQMIRSHIGPIVDVKSKYRAVFTRGNVVSGSAYPDTLSRIGRSRGYRSIIVRSAGVYQHIRIPDVCIKKATVLNANAASTHVELRIDQFEYDKKVKRFNERSFELMVNFLKSANYTIKCQLNKSFTIYENEAAFLANTPQSIPTHSHPNHRSQTHTHSQTLSPS